MKIFFVCSTSNIISWSNWVTLNEIRCFCRCPFMFIILRKKNFLKVWGKKYEINIFLIDWKSNCIEYVFDIVFARNKPFYLFDFVKKECLMVQIKNTMRLTRFQVISLFDSANENILFLYSNYYFFISNSFFFHFQI